MNLGQDLKFGARMLLKNPGFSAVALFVLALGIGANTAIFSVVNAALLRPLPFEDPGRLVQIWHVPPAQSFPGMKRFSVSAANYLDWAAQNHVFEKTAIYRYDSLDMTGAEKPESIPAGAVEHTFFSIFGVRPMLGRTFVPEEDQAGHGNVVVLSYGFWQSHFGGNPKIVGQRITLNSESYMVVGVMGRKFLRPDWAQIWTPLNWSDKERAVRGEHHFLVVGRLKPGVDLKQAQAEMNTISRRLEQQYPADDKGWGAVVVPLREEMVGDVRPALEILLGAVAFVLLIACANVANLVLARSLTRRKEIAIRAALGASRGRIVQQVLLETVLLSLMGGVLGLIVAKFGVDFIAAYLAGKLPRTIDVKLDGWVLAFTLVISVFTGMLAGLLPAWRLTKTNLNDALKQGLGRTDADSGGRKSLDVLVVSEMALSLMLLIGAGLMIRSLWQLRKVDPGIDPHHVLTMTVSVAPKKFSAPAQQIAYFQKVTQALTALPGVESEGVIDSLPFSGNGSTQPIAIEGRPAVAMADQPEVAVRLIDPGYLTAMRIPLLRGRMINQADNAQAHSVIVISESMAKRFWPNEDPIGKHLTLTFSPNQVREIVGVIGDVKQYGLDVVDPVATLYSPLAQMAPPKDSAYGDWSSFPLSLVVRTNQDAKNMVSAVTNAVHEVDATAPVLDVMTMDDLIDDSLSQHRFNMLLLTGFAGLALLLAGVGIYSVLSYSVRRRVREIGIRMALGAQVSQVLRLIVIQGMKPTLIGLAIGLAGAFALGRVLATITFGISATDIATYAAVSALLIGTGLLASIIPAQRASRVDPIRTLHEE